MIISHKHKFIFFKPRKVAGTSLEIALAKHCGPQDIITPVGEQNLYVSDRSYEHTPRNDRGFYGEMSPKELKKKISKAVWDSYLKITIVRNPWDMVVSRWHHFKYKYENPTGFESMPSIISRLFSALHDPGFTKERVIVGALYRLYLKKNRDIFSNGKFQKYVETFPFYFTNNSHYFDSDGNIYFDKVLRFENILEEFDELCEQLGIQSKTLPKANSKIRKSKRHYSLYYDKLSKKIIEKKFQRQIDIFKYSFESIGEAQ